MFICEEGFDIVIQKGFCTKNLYTVVRTDVGYTDYNKTEGR